MKLFISWSGETSHSVALVLRNWIPKILHDIEPFVSSEDIGQGNIWNHELIKVIKDSKFAIVCVTKYNLKSSWLNFEAGALSKYESNGVVCPFLFNMDNSDLRGPLSQFQTIVSDSDTEKITSLLKSIRDCYGLQKPNNNTINDLVIKLYDDLKLDLARIKDDGREDLSIRSEKIFMPNSLFVSTPMSSFPVSTDLIENNKIIELALAALESNFDLSTINCPAKNITSQDDFNDKESAIVDDLIKLQQSEFFLCIYPARTVSSVLVEIGYAISKGKKSIIIVKSRKDLPYLLQEADRSINNLKIYEVEDLQTINKFIAKTKGLFSFIRI